MGIEIITFFICNILAIVIVMTKAKQNGRAMSYVAIDYFTPTWRPYAPRVFLTPF